MQVLLNLSHNALKYTFDREVKIQAQVKTPSVLTIEVSDTGIGIKNDVKDKVFDLFGLVDKKEQNNETGSANNCDRNRN